ncbi:MAG: outer membrane lipoprotein chaperone LolA [Proteobacteria bacterium]|nr:outer membrane lipoprotein chaperone LolA [Pseudomonadota bacterium]
MIRKFILLFVIACSAANVAAQSSVDEMGEMLVHHFLTDVTTMQGRFEQSLIDADGTVVEVTSGTLEIERPVRFRWSYSEPYEQWLIADGLNVWSYDLDLQQVTVKPQRDALANTPALLLGGAKDALAQFNFGGTTVDEVTTWVRLEPKDKNSGFKRIELGFIDGKLMRMMFFDNLQQTTLIELHDVTINEPIDAERFEFSAPDGVDVVGVPITTETADF